MTVQSSVSRADYTGNGVTTLFVVPFYFLDPTHIKVLRTDTSTTPPTVSLLVLNSDYTVTGAGVQGGGSVTTTVAPSATQKLTVVRNVPFTQLIHYVPNDPFPAATHEQALDQLTMEVQQIGEAQTHALQLPTYEPTPNALPPAASRASTLLGFDANGNPTVLPQPASVGAGDLRWDIFTAGANFTPGTTTSLTLSRAPGTVANVEVFFDATFQGPDQILTLVGAALTFTAPIPVGVQKVFVRSGTTLSVQTPPIGSVTDAMVAAGTKLSNRLADWVDVRDFGAKGDGVTDDTAAVQAAINAVNPFTWQGTTRATELNSTGGTVYFPPGTYLVTSKIRLAPQVRLLGAGPSNDWSSRSGVNGTATGGTNALGSCIKSTVSNFSTYAFDTSPWSNAGVRADDYLQTGGDSTNGTHTQVSGVCIENMTLLGNWTAKGLNLAGADLYRLKNVYIKGFTVGLRESGVWYGSCQDVRIVANYRGILSWQSVTDVVRYNTHVLYQVDGVSYNPAVSGRDSGDPPPVLDLTQAMIDLATGVVNYYGNVEGINVDVENFPQAFLTLNGVDSYRGVYVEGISQVILRVQGPDQQNSYFEFDTVTANSGDLIWSSNARLTVEVRSHNYTQSGFGKLYNFLNSNSNRLYVPAVRGVFENAGDTVGAALVRNLPDDYGEGGWVPILGFGGVAAGTQARSTGKWIRNGRLVTCKFSIQIPTLSGATGNAAINGLPFPPENIDGTDFMGGVVVFSFSAPAGMLCQVQPGVSGIYLTNNAGTILTNTGFSNGVDIRGQVTYMVQTGS